MTEEERVNRMWHFMFGNGKPGVDERLRAVEATAQLSRDTHAFMQDLRTGWRVLKWVGAVAVPAAGWFGWYVINLLQQLQAG